MEQLYTKPPILSVEEIVRDFLVIPSIVIGLKGILLVDYLKLADSVYGEYVFYDGASAKYYVNLYDADECNALLDWIDSRSGSAEDALIEAFVANGLARVKSLDSGVRIQIGKTSSRRVRLLKIKCK